MDVLPEDFPTDLRAMLEYIDPSMDAEERTGPPPCEWYVRCLRRCYLIVQKKNNEVRAENNHLKAELAKLKRNAVTAKRELQKELSTAKSELLKAMKGMSKQLDEQMEEQRNGLRIQVMGLPDRFFEHGKRELLLKEAGLTTDDIVLCAQTLLKKGLVYAQ